MPPIDPTVPSSVLNALNDLAQAANQSAAAADMASSKSRSALAAAHDSELATSSSQTAAQAEAQKLTQLQSLLASVYGPPAVA